MSDELASPFGYPLRRNSSNSCLTTEKDCGATWGTFRRCCPHGTSCADDCCPSTADCQQRIKSNPHCANDSADLYRALDANGSPAGGYFCCTTNAIGFQKSANSFVGCANSVDLLNSSFSLASLVKRAETASSTSAMISSTATSTASTTSTPTSTSSSSSSSSNNTGAIAGGVVGGVAGAALILALIWFFIRRRKQQQQQQQQQHPVEVSSNGGPPGTAESTPLHPSSGTMGSLPVEQYKPVMMAELQSPQGTPSPTMQELEGRTVYELPGQHQQQHHQLP